MYTQPELDRLEGVRRSTADYGHRQGLYMVVLGLFVGTLAFARFREEPVAPVLVGAVLLAAVADHYRRRFGTVVPRRKFGRVPTWLSSTLLVILVLAVVPVWVVVVHGLGVDRHLVGGLLFAGVFAILGAPNWRERIHYLVSAVVLAAVALIPIGTVLPTGEHPLAIDDPVVLLLVVGALLIVNGAMDHRALVRSISRPADTEGEK